MQCPRSLKRQIDLLLKKQPPIIPEQIISRSARSIGAKKEICLQIPSEMAQRVSKDKLETV